MMRPWARLSDRPEAPAAPTYAGPGPALIAVETAELRPELAEEACLALTFTLGSQLGSCLIEKRFSASEGSLGAFGRRHDQLVAQLLVKLVELSACEARPR